MQIMMRINLVVEQDDTTQVALEEQLTFKLNEMCSKIEDLEKVKFVSYRVQEAFEL